MDTEGINHPLLEQLNLSCKYSVERRSVASCYQGSKSSRSQQSLSLDCSAKKKKLEFPVRPLGKQLYRFACLEQLLTHLKKLEKLQ